MIKILFSLFIFGSCSLFHSNTYKDSIILNASFWNKESDQIRFAEGDNSKDVKLFLEKWKIDAGVSQGQKLNTNLSKESLKVDIVKSVLSNLPLKLKKFLNKNISIIVLTSDLSVSQLIFPMKDGKFIMFVDSRINNIGLNDWYKQREHTALNGKTAQFSLNPLLSLSNSTNDTLEFVFAQSIALILSYNKNIFVQDLSNEEEFKSNAYISQSWIMENKIIKSVWSRYLSEIRFISYYGKSSRSINFDKVYEFYQLLERTNFVNLFASTSPLKDFVETTSIYIHNIYYKRPFYVEFNSGDLLLDSYSNCIINSRCLKKTHYIEKVLNSYL